MKNLKHFWCIVSKSTLVYLIWGQIRKIFFYCPSPFSKNKYCKFPCLLYSTVPERNTVVFLRCRSPSLMFFWKRQNRPLKEMSIMLSISTDESYEKFFVLSGLTWNNARSSTRWHVPRQTATFKSVKIFLLNLITCELNYLMWCQISFGHEWKKTSDK